uniref:Uncharacterized protein n=1 Tax=Arundo donax TaxID=35708 RepID=A0A0A9HRJ2_ARUDO
MCMHFVSLYIYYNIFSSMLPLIISFRSLLCNNKVWKPHDI